MTEDYYNSPEYKAKQEQWLKEIEEEQEAKQVANALSNQYAHPDYVQKRLEQIHTTLRNYSEESQAKHQTVQAERNAYLAKAGQLDPWLLLEQVGFKVHKLNQGHLATRAFDGKKIQISLGYHTQDKITVTHKNDQNDLGVNKHFAIPKTADDVYKIASEFVSDIYFGAKHLAQYETNYVKALKQRKK